MQSRFVRLLGRRLAPLGLGFGAAVPAFAEVPASVLTAITGTGADMVTVITAVIVAFVAFWGLRKLGSKMGWN